MTEPPDVDAWLPFHPSEAAAVLAGTDVPWAVAGGWAIDLHLGQQTRLHEEMSKIAFAQLKAGVVPAAEAWRDSIDVAARRGDHRPARDLLLHTKVIEPVHNSADSGITIQIGGALDVNLDIVMQPAGLGALRSEAE